MATPPRFGIDPSCEVRPFGKAKRFFILETVTIEGMAYKEMARAKIKLLVILNQSGREKTEGLIISNFIFIVD